MSSVTHLDATFVVLDVHKDSISVGVLRPGEVSPDVDRIFHDEPSIRRLIAGFADPELLRVCYEAGPTGYGLARLLTGMGVACQVIAPALIPRRRATRSRPTVVTAGGWLGCTVRAS